MADTPVAAGRPVIVTGAGSGIGLATSVELARRGFRVTAAAHRQEGREAVEGAARDAGVDLEAIVLDVLDEGSGRDLLDRHDRLYALVNNAGYSNLGALEDVSDEEARRQFEVMVLAPARLARLALPHLRAHGDGRIVMVTSVLARLTSPLMGWYDASKHALEALADSLRVEVASSGVRVVTVEPGLVDTPIWDRTRWEAENRPPGRYREAYERWSRAALLARPLFSRPQQVADTIAASLEARHPRAHYNVGRGAWIGSVAYQVTPPVVRDWLVRAALRL